MLYQTICINIEKIACDRNSMFKTMQDMQNGKISYSGSKPLDMFFVSEGKHKDKYVLKDGYHRLFALMLQGKKEIQVFVDEIGNYSDCLYAVNQLFTIDPSQKYSGLEDLADEEILEDIFKFL